MSVLSLPDWAPDPAAAASLPWVQSRSGSEVVAAAAPLLLPALRRLMAEPSRWHTPEELDSGRATSQTLTHIASWHRLHDPKPGDALASLSHATEVLHGCGLVASRVAAVQRACLPVGGGAVDDSTLMVCAHLSEFEVIETAVMSVLVGFSGWTPGDLLAWSLQFPAGHLSACEAVRLDPTVLRDRLREGTAPTVEQVRFVTAMRAPVPGIATPPLTRG